MGVQMCIPQNKNKSKHDRNTKPELNRNKRAPLGALLRNILKTFRRTVVLTNRLLGRSRPLASSRQKGSGEKATRSFRFKVWNYFTPPKELRKGRRSKNFAKIFFVERGFLFAVRFARLVVDSSVYFGDFPLVDAFFRPDFFTRKRRFCRYYYSAAKKRRKIFRTPAFRAPRPFLD